MLPPKFSKQRLYDESCMKIDEEHPQEIAEQELERVNREKEPRLKKKRTGNISAGEP